MSSELLTFKTGGGTQYLADSQVISATRPGVRCTSGVQDRWRNSVLGRGTINLCHGARFQVLLVLKTCGGTHFLVEAQVISVIRPGVRCTSGIQDRLRYSVYT